MDLGELSSTGEEGTLCGGVPRPHAVVKEYFPCPYVASCPPPLSMSMAAVFRLHSLRDHCLALVRMSEQARVRRYWSVKKLGVYQTPHEVLWELSSPAIHCSSLTSCCCDTHTLSIVGVCYTCSWGCGMPLPIA